MDLYDDAISEFERVLRIAANYPLANFHIAQAYRGKGMADRATASHQTFLEVWKNAHPDLPQIIEAKAFLKSGK